MKSLFFRNSSLLIFVLFHLLSKVPMCLSSLLDYKFLDVGDHILFMFISVMLICPERHSTNVC